MASFCTLLVSLDIYFPILAYDEIFLTLSSSMKTKTLQL